MPSMTLSASIVALFAANAVSGFVVAPVPAGVAMVRLFLAWLVCLRLRVIAILP